MPPVWDGLVSFHYHRTADKMAAVAGLARHGARFIGDSGAFSAHTQGSAISVDDFTAWAHAYGKHLVWIASLDVLQDPVASWANYRALKTNGVDRLVPTIHQHTPPQEMDRYVEDGATLIGLGAVAMAPKNDATLRWLVSCFRYARQHHPQVRFHGWGMTTLAFLRNLPFWSVDSSAPGSTYRYGKLPTFDPITGRKSIIAMDGRTPAKHARIILQQYGVRPTDVARSTAANRQLMCRLSVDFTVHMTEYFTRRHHVSPPQVCPDHPGTRVHYADADPSTWSRLLQLIEKEPV